MAASPYGVGWDNTGATPQPQARQELHPGDADREFMFQLGIGTPAAS
jgi:hypothetical protein